tara:strand:+ start:82 stop:1008 length:927 start_codon:yes stop_codon:yes gene_type:complete
MKIYKGFDSFPKLSKAVITTGTFDGVHLGHKKILDALINIGVKNNTETVLVTFSPHPRIVLFPDHDLKLINTIDENIELLKKNNIDHLIIQQFDKKFSRITSLDYVRDILLKKIGLKDLVIGFNHHFGRNREGSFEDLEEYANLYDFSIHQVGAYDINEQSVSSTKIRNALNNGDIQLANHYLGYNFKIFGKIIKGQGIGKNIGFPTANISLGNSNKLTPKKGVYAVNVYWHNHKLQGMLNIGVNPTMHNNKSISIEVNIFDFNKDIYGEILHIEFVQRIRNEKKFPTIDDLKHQLNIDRIAALNILN